MSGDQKEIKSIFPDMVLRVMSAVKSITGMPKTPFSSESHKFRQTSISLHSLSYTHFCNYSLTCKRKSPEELKTLNIGTILLDYAAFVRIHMVERFS